VLGPDDGCSRTVPVSLDGDVIRLQVPEEKATGTNG